MVQPSLSNGQSQWHEIREGWGCQRGSSGESQTWMWISRVRPRESDVLTKLLKASRGYLG